LQILGFAPRIYTVSELTVQLRELVGSAFSAVWVVGEVSNLSCPRSGHLYLTLKDQAAQLPAVIWRSVAQKLRFQLHDGLEVVCYGYLDVYPPHGRYQLVIQHLEPKGLGALELAFRQLYEKLAREGLFDPSRKRPLPPLVRRVALVTSPAGAAVHDFLKILSRRWLGGYVLVVPTRVQGEKAAEEIAAAVATANRLTPTFDCLVLARGGGSAEDLWAFNEEVVVRAIAASRLPVVSAVGHEIDVTLADLAADLRALTPSEAAERISPDRQEIRQRLLQLERRLVGLMRQRLRQAQLRFQMLARASLFRRPKDWIYERAQEVDEWAARLHRAIRDRLTHSRQRLQQLSLQLEALSPLAVLTRGYSLTYLLPENSLVRDARVLSPGAQLLSRFAHGSAISRVETVHAAGREAAAVEAPSFPGQSGLPPSAESSG
jgi:exodeoxyribonuclease VII large subunit